MNRKQLAELLKSCSPKQLYVVTWNNALKLLVCPFKVKVKADVGELKKGDFVWVDLVKVTPELRTVYIISEKAYYYHHFEIII